MRSIIEEIAEAEQQADEIRAGAAANARDQIAAARVEAEKALEALDVSEREQTRAALEQAEKDGEAISREMAASMEQDADALTAQARSRMDAVVNYLLDKVQKTA